MSLIVSAIIIGILLFPNSTAKAISVNIEGLEGQSIDQDETFEFYINVSIESSERVPVSTVRVTVEGPTSFTYEFSLTGGEQAYLRFETPQTVIDDTVYDYTYRYGYGYFYGYGHISGYGYGYYPAGYGYGFYGAQTLIWRVRLINTGGLPAGDYRAEAEIQSNGVWWGGAPTETSFSIVAVVPSVIGYSPTGTAVPIDTTISVTFSESMNKTSVEEAFSISPTVSGSFSWTDNTMIFTPDAALGYSVEYTVTISTVAKDVAGRSLESPFSWQFTTTSAPPPPPPVEVKIDIKPGSYPNPINLKSKGRIPVAIITDEDFDATTVDPETVRFGPAEARAVHSSLEDLDGDEDLDIVLHFKTQDTGILPGDTEATLTGETYDGLQIIGRDGIKIVPKQRTK